MNLTKTFTRDKDMGNVVIAYVLGFMAMQNVMYAFKIGNTYINYVYLFSTILIGYNLIFNNKKVITEIVGINRFWKLYICLILLSLFSYTLTIFRYPALSVSSYFNGIIYFALIISYYISILIYKDYKKIIIKGLWHGTLVNIGFSLLQFIFFEKGSYLSLYNIFPQQYYYVSIPWESRNLLTETIDLIYSYRATGLFLETSHLISCISAIGIIVLSQYGKRLFFLIAWIILTFLIVMSGSGNLVIYIITFILYFFIKSYIILKKRRKIKKVTLAYISVGILLTVVGSIVLAKVLDLSKFTEMILIGFKTANLADSDNVIRSSYMINALKTIGNYPFGIGFNLAPRFLDYLYGTHATFNYFLTIWLELGPIAVMGYIVYILKSFIFMIRKSTSYSIALATSLLIISMVQFANGTAFATYIIAIFALVEIEKRNVKKINDISSNMMISRL